jgi:hypothetical protein
MRTISVQQRRQTLVRCHCLGGDAESPEDATRAVVVLHATDPASVYLSVLARSAGSTLADVSEALYERRNLVRWMAMRRTLFLLRRDDVPLVQAAVSTPLAATLRKRLASQLERNGSEPPIKGDVGRWLTRLEDRVERALETRGTATGAQLSADEPALRTAIPPRTVSERPMNVTSSLLTLMSAQGRIVRSTPTGAWTSRHHRWEPIGRWWPDGLPQLDEANSQRDLAHRWLERFGPATVDDLQWWTGWNKTTTRRAISDLPIDDVDLHGQAGITLRAANDSDEHATSEPVAALLPALDPTPMGWKHRDWFLGVDPHQIFDRAGNIGPTLWWDGEIIGSWAVTRGGEIRTAILADRGAAAANAVDQAAAQLHKRIDGTVVTPAARTPLERSLVDD